MTALQEQAVELIQQMSEEQVYYLVHMLKSMQAAAPSVQDPSPSMQAYQTLQKYRKPSQKEPDYKAELAAAREEKYENIG